jgi:hypothetical protein
VGAWRLRGDTPGSAVAAAALQRTHAQPRCPQELQAFLTSVTKTQVMIDRSTDGTHSAAWLRCRRDRRDAKPSAVAAP